MNNNKTKFHKNKRICQYFNWSPEQTQSPFIENIEK